MEKEEKKEKDKTSKVEGKKEKKKKSEKTNEEKDEDLESVSETDPVETESQEESEEIPDGHYGVEAVLGTGTWKPKGRGGRGARYWLIQFEGEDPETQEKWLPDWQPDSCVLVPLE